MSMRRGCDIFRARRSYSRERLSRIKDFIRMRRCVCTPVSVVVTGSNTAAVIPEKLGWKIGERNEIGDLKTHRVR